jgi:hypothetical protein
MGFKQASPVLPRVQERKEKVKRKKEKGKEKKTINFLNYLERG